MATQAVPHPYAAIRQWWGADRAVGICAEYATDKDECVALINHMSEPTFAEYGESKAAAREAQWHWVGNLYRPAPAPISEPDYCQAEVHEGCGCPLSVDVERGDSHYAVGGKWYR